MGCWKRWKKKRFIDALDVKPLTQEEIDRFLNKQQSSNSTQESNESGQNPDEKPFKAIQGESKNKETYKDDNAKNELVKKLLEDKFSTSKELELLFGVKFSDDDAGEFNKILSFNSAPKSIDIKAWKCKNLNYKKEKMLNILTYKFKSSFS